MTTLKISTHDGQDYEETVEQYDAAALNAELNNNEINTVAIGNLIISRVNVKLVVEKA
ncbi:hypothetical protein [Caldifermentibacillus hisashii]|jgi:hypothetical protein|uniref:hypothetical protein n=1 Tax=Caldifermentibacillus hisashii TaxID=996558 RepID=UPI0030E96417